MEEVDAKMKILYKQNKSKGNMCSVHFEIKINNKKSVKACPNCSIFGTLSVFFTFKIRQNFWQHIGLATTKF